jgi:protein-L-isoaspartate(D-aspartate) O-methyltransferase
MAQDASMVVDGAMDPPEARARRAALVDEVAVEVAAPRVLSALRAVPRHLFVPEASLAEAYEDHPMPIGEGQTISQPTVVGLMSEALELTGEERVLEVGAGSGYQAAVLAVLAREVDTLEIVPELAARAARALALLRLDNVRVHFRDGWVGLPSHAPFDRIVVTAAPDVLPVALLEQLAEGGRLVLPVGPQRGDQRLLVLEKQGGSVQRRDLGGVRFVPMVRSSRRMHGPRG